MAEAGLPELVTGSMQGVVLPARTPKPIVDRWHADVAKIVALPEIRDRLIGFGLEPVANTPPEFEAGSGGDREVGEAMRAAKIDRI
jgi:tripartite-type tricarboxylate transporter receptor subunit TctC